MRNPLTVAVAQPATTSVDVTANVAAHTVAVRSARARVVVFPEMSLTGYALDGPALAADDSRLAPLIAACAETGTLALAGAPVPGDHIATLAVDGAGAAVTYRKMWLGGQEPERFTPGDRPVVLDVDGWRLGLAICKDFGVEQHAAATAALGIDAYLAGVLEHDTDVSIVEERARRVATTHRVWVAAASFAGSTGGGYHRAAGHSGIWDPDGVPVTKTGPETDAIARVTIS